MGWMVLSLAAGEEDEATRVAKEAMSIAVVPLVPHAHPEGTAAAAHLPTESQRAQSMREAVSRGSNISTQLVRLSLSASFSGISDGRGTA